MLTRLFSKWWTSPPSHWGMLPIMTLACLKWTCGIFPNKKKKENQTVRVINFTIEDHFVNSLDTRLKRISKLLDLVFIYILRNAPTSIGIEVFITVRKPAWGRQTLLGEHTDVTHDKICNDWDTTLYPWYFLPCLLEPSQMNVSLRDNPILSFLLFFLI